MFKDLCPKKMKQAFLNLNKLKSERKTSNYNFKDEKSRMLFELNKDCPCAEEVLVNTKHIERAFKLCKKLLKNMHSPEHMNDCVKDELRPHDLKHTWAA